MRYSPDSNTKMLEFNSSRLDILQLGLTEGKIQSLPQSNVKLANSPTYDQIVNGFTAGGGTEVPTVLTLFAEGKFKGIVLQLVKQPKLTNLKEYQYQVSDDNATWYSLKEDGTDWKDTLAATTSKNTEYFVHVFPLDVDGVTGEPLPTLLFYRVRQRTVLDAYSGWSISTFATASNIDNGDMAFNSVDANTITASAINAQFANIGYQMTLGFESKTGLTTYDAPGYGDTRWYFDNDEILYQIYVYDDAGSLNWVTTIGMGGQNLEGVITAMIKSRGLYNDDDLIPEDDLVPDRSFLHFDLNDTYDEKRGMSGYLTGYGSPTFEATTWNAKLAKSVKLGNGMGLTGLTNFTSLQKSFSLSFYFKYTGTGVTNIFVAGFLGGFPYFYALQLELDYTSSEINLYIKRAQADPAQTITISSIDFSKWQFVSIVWNIDDSKIFLRVDNQVVSHTIVGNFTNGNYPLTIIGAGVGDYNYISDIVISGEQAIDPDIFFAHYSNGAIWNSNHAQNDLVMLSAGQLSMAHGFITPFTIETTTNEITINNLMLEVDNKFFSFPVSYTIAPTLSASTWYALVVSSTGVLSLETIASITDWTGESLANNQLNCYENFDYSKNYMYLDDSRIIAVLKSNRRANGYDYQIPVYNIPKSKMQAQFGSTQSLPGGTTVLKYDTIDVDINSEYAVGTGIITKKANGKLAIRSIISDISDITAYRKLQSIRSSRIGLIGRYSLATASITAFVGQADSLSEVIKNETIQTEFYNGSAGTITMNASINNKLIIEEV